MEDRGGRWLFQQGDHLGTPSMLTDTDGVVVGRQKSLPFGERFLGTGEKSLRRFTNHEDGAQFPIYMQARMYLPTYGRFAQVDPAYDQVAMDPDSWNLYSYCTNNPVTRTDPDGMREIGREADMRSPWKMEFDFWNSNQWKADSLDAWDHATIQRWMANGIFIRYESDWIIKIGKGETSGKVMWKQNNSDLPVIVEPTNTETGAAKKDALVLQEEPETVTISLLFDTKSVSGHLGIETPDRIVGYHPDLANSPITPDSVGQKIMLGLQWVSPTNPIIPGVVKNDKRSDFNYALPPFTITKGQYAALNKMIDANLKGKYNVQNMGAVNCAGWALAMLKGAGIPLGTRTSSGAIREIPYNAPRMTPGVLWHDWLGRPW